MAKKEKYNVAVVGALGIVGREMKSTLERKNFPVNEFRPLGTKRYEGKEVIFNGKPCKAFQADRDTFKGIDIAIFSAGGAASKELAPIAAEEGAVVIDNSSQWRMDPKCPLVVPEVNPQDLDWHNGIIANPNCSTIQMLVALKPLHDYAGIKRIVVSTYQSVSGSGKVAFNGLKNESEEFLSTGKVSNTAAYEQQIAFNCLAHIDVFQEGGYTKEEYKMVNETRKILDKTIKTTATCVRVPVFYGHCESVNIETKNKITREKAIELLEKAPSITVMDDPENNVYPSPIMTNNLDNTLVGRIREDDTIENGLNLWIVSNNIKKGAALNSVEIAETLLQRNLV
ncbi:MAG: aspartate-semialdehyde dehydrogenase [Victivallales bacterium]|nr:aspartate-semialdehyde dehydrogenase [Victivallales bacterium]